MRPCMGGTHALAAMAAMNGSSGRMEAMEATNGRMKEMAAAVTSLAVAAAEGRWGSEPAGIMNISEGTRGTLLKGGGGMEGAMSR